MSSILPKATISQNGQSSSQHKKMLPPANPVIPPFANPSIRPPTVKSGSSSTSAQQPNSATAIPKVRLKVVNNNAAPPSTSQFFSDVGPSGPRPRPPVKYHYPIILDDDEEDDEDDDGDGDYAEDDGTFSSQRKRKDSVQVPAETIRKNPNEGKHKKAVNKKTDGIRDRKGKGPIRDSGEPSRVNGSIGKGDTERDKRAADVLKSKKKDQKLASIQRNSARRDKLNSGLGNSQTIAKASGFEDDSDELSSLPDEYKSEDDETKNDRKIKREKRRRRHGHKRCSCSSHSHRHRHKDRHALPLESAFAGSLGADLQSPSGQPQALDNEPQLPEGIDPTNVEDVFLDVAPPTHAWSTDDEEEEILFAALDDFEDAVQTDDGGVADTDATEDDSSATFSSDSDDDDFFMNDEFGFGAPSDLPLVLMEDWSGNLVFAQPVIESEEKPRPSRATSKSRSKGSRRSGKGSKASSGSTINGEGPALLVDAEAFDTEGDAYDDGMSDGGDTTDSLPEEDMPSPPDIIPFSLAAAGLEANNAAFGVTTVDEAALARDLGLPLTDARHLLERARAEEQQQILGGVSGLTMESDVVMADPMDLNSAPLDPLRISSGHTDPTIQNQSRTSSSSLLTPPILDALSPGGTMAASPAPSAAASMTGPIGIPLMGSFVRDVADPERVAVIDGTGKNAPSPFVRKGVARGRSRGLERASVKKRTFGQSPAASPVRRPRYSSVPASSRFGTMRGSPLHPNMRHEPFEREDTPSDMEIMVEPISIDDVLDVDALHHYTHDMDGQASSDSHDPPRHLRNLQRWERVPITTFRRSRHVGDPTLASPAQQSPAGPFRGSFSSPSMASTLAGASTGPLGYAHGMIVSPILEAVHEQSYNHEMQPRRRKGRKPTSNGTLARNRTSSLGSMPPLNLGR